MAGTEREADSRWRGREWRRTKIRETELKKKVLKVQKAERRIKRVIYGRGGIRSKVNS